MQARPAGSPFNVAVGLARLGHPVAFCGGLSAGYLGRHLRGQLQREGVDCNLCQTLEAPTTLSLVQADADGTPQYTFYGTGGADRLLTDVAALPQDIAAIQVGSYSLVVEPVAHALRALVTRERERRLVSCDLNLRLAVEPSLARWLEASTWYAARTHLMKASEEDVFTLSPSADVDAVARGWLSAGCECVVITHGADGASAWNAQGRVRVPGLRVDVVDTVGAGDAFQAAMLAALAERGTLQGGALRQLDGAALRDILCFANRAAAVVCGRQGADPARRLEIDASVE